MEKAEVNASTMDSIALHRINSNNFLIILLGPITPRRHRRIIETDANNAK
jgi:hypothetical protein